MQNSYQDVQEYHLIMLQDNHCGKSDMIIRHGTGHGVGYLLNVHEQPNAFRYMLREMLKKMQNLNRE